MTYRPEVRLVDDFTFSYDFNKAWQTTNEMRFSPDADLRRGKVYTRLALRCRDDFQCSKIIWHDYNLK
jgi:hypothetical protein